MQCRQALQAVKRGARKAKPPCFSRACFLFLPANRFFIALDSGPFQPPDVKPFSVSSRLAGETSSSSSDSLASSSASGTQKVDPSKGP